MKNRKHSKLKRTPIVRFIRGIFRLWRAIFRPKSRNIRAIPDDRSEQTRLESAQRQSELAQQQIELKRQQVDLDRQARERLITVGDLFDRVKWQVPEATILQEHRPEASRIARPYDVSRN
jgi:hypothetical protein